MNKHDTFRNKKTGRLDGLFKDDIDASNEVDIGWESKLIGTMII
jgi:hypothetical protein